MESLFCNRGPNITVKLRNNHDTYLAASNDEKSLTLVSPILVGYTPKQAEWTIKFRSTTSEYTEFSLWSFYNKELAGQKGENGEIVFCQKIPNSSRPWRSDNSQPLSGGIYLFCDCETRDWVSDFYKLSATHDGTILAIPSFVDTLEDPGSWWFIEVVEKISPETGTISKQAPETSSTSSVLHQHPVPNHRLTDIEQLHGINFPNEDQSTSYGWSAPGSSYHVRVGSNNNGAGNQNIGDVKIKSKFSVTKPGHGMTPYNIHEGLYFGNSPPETQDEQPSYNPEHHLGSFDRLNLGSSTPSSSHGAPFSQSYNLGTSTRDTTPMRPNSGAPGFHTYFNTGNNTNGSGTQTNNVSIKSKGPIFKNW
ncbi:hypothetical protein RND81_11G169500 [Saponaria officinalis]|uniref:Uncharacterized protein n=1 Tax=Saponaria officinalis TaxID=3572 RepID=A0AAW1HN15_SAPOF